MIESTAIPVGKQKLFQALRDAGIQAQRLRNVPWITRAGDGVTVMNAWRSQIEIRGNELVAVINARDWTGKGIRERKRAAVVEGLVSQVGQLIRVVILEERIRGDRQVKAAHCDDALWLVEDTGSAFHLWRGRQAIDSDSALPQTPNAYGKIVPQRREAVSSRIERDSRVRRITLARAGNHCEITDCRDGSDYETPDVHHITALGANGSDHTDNTVALCPACHTRVHRGVPLVRSKLELEIKRVRRHRAKHSN